MDIIESNVTKRALHDDRVFLTEFGKEFEERFEDLSGYISINNLLPILLQIGQGFQEISEEIIKDPFKSKDYLEIFLKWIIEVNKLSEEKLEAANSIIVKILEQIDNIINSGAPKVKELQNLFQTFSEITKKENSSSFEKTQPESEETSFADLFEQTKQFQRMNANFIFSLYSYIDIYTDSLLREIITLLPTGLVYENIRKIARQSSNPIDRVNLGLELLSDTEPTLKQIREILISEKGWGKHQEGFGKIKEVRNIIAHETPLFALEQFQKEFPDYKKTVKKHMEDLYSVLDRYKLPSFVKGHFQALSEIENLFYSIEIANSCFRYLALNEILVCCHIIQNSGYYDFEMQEILCSRI